MAAFFLVVFFVLALIFVFVLMFLSVSRSGTVVKEEQKRGAPDNREFCKRLREEWAKNDRELFQLIERLKEDQRCRLSGSVPLPPPVWSFGGHNFLWAPLGIDHRSVSCVAESAASHI